VTEAWDWNEARASASGHVRDPRSKLVVVAVSQGCQPPHRLTTRSLRRSHAASAIDGLMRSLLETYEERDEAARVFAAGARSVVRVPAAARRR